MSRILLYGLPFFLMMFFLKTAEGNPGDPATSREIQARAFDLVNVGEFERARVEFGHLAEMKGERLAKTAWFHWGNLIELYAMMDALSLEDARKCLLEAREAHRRALEGLDAQPDPGMPHLRGEFESHRRAVDAKLESLERIERGEVSMTDAAEMLDDMNAPGAAASLLQGKIDPADPSSDIFCFLSLVYRMSVVDHLYLRLENMEKAQKTPSRELIDHEDWVRALDELDETTLGVHEQVEMAIQAYPGSPHWLDFLMYSADTHRYRGYLFLMLAENPAEAATEELRREYESWGLAELRHMMGRTNEILRFTEEALADRSILSPRQKLAYPASKLDTYGILAERGLEEAAPWMEENEKQP